MDHLPDTSAPTDTPPAVVTPIAAPEPAPVPHPAEGGSYVRDPATHELTRVTA